jgi:hypothetical protein
MADEIDHAWIRCVQRFVDLRMTRMDMPCDFFIGEDASAIKRVHRDYFEQYMIEIVVAWEETK